MPCCLEGLNVAPYRGVDWNTAGNVHNYTKVKAKGKVLHITCHEDPEGE